jgi:kinesin family protein 5
MKGVKNRVVRQTSMNAKSSRSHSIFQLLVEIQGGSGSFLKGRLNLCDLAGS